MELRCKAVLFDLDGTLIDSTESILRAYEPAIVELGLDRSRVHSILAGRSADSVLMEASGGTLDPRLAEKARAEIVEREVLDPEGIVVLPGAVELLQSLPEDRWAIVTACRPELADVRLKVGLPRPRVLIPSDPSRPGKPAPDGYLLAAETLGFEPGDCVVVEDAEAGIQAAEAAGMMCVAVRTTCSDEELSGADIVVDTPADIHARLEGDHLVLVTGTDRP